MGWRLFVSCPAAEKDSCRNEHASRICCIAVNLFRKRLFMTVKSDFQPQIVDKFNQPILDPKAIYGGCRVVVAVAFFGYGHLGNYGVSCSMRAIIKIADGDPIGGGRLDTGQVFAAYIDKTTPQDMLRNNPAFASKHDYYSDAADNIGF